MRGNQTGRHTFIMLAGVYLLYLSWQLFSGFKNGEASSPVFILAAVLFAVAGVVIIVTNIKAIIKLTNEAQNAEAEDTDSTEETSSDASDQLPDDTASAENSAADTGNQENQ